jgi:hypothetical protein
MRNDGTSGEEVRRGVRGGGTSDDASKEEAKLIFD